MRLPALSPFSPLSSVLDDIQRSIKVGLYYPALLATLTLPEICVGLTLDGDAFVKQKHYVAFVDKYSTPSNLGVDGESCYHLRGGIVHRANMAGHPYFGATHVIFTIPHLTGTLHALSLESHGKRAAMFDLVLFCNEMIAAVGRWYEDHQNDAKVNENMKNLIRFCPDGLSLLSKDQLLRAAHEGA